MTGGDVAQIITSIATLIAALTGTWVSMRNGQKIEEVHKTTNGKMEELVTAVRIAAESKGRDDERRKPTV